MNNPHPPTIELQHQDWAERIPNPAYLAWQQGYEARGQDNFEAGYQQGQEDVANKTHEH